MARRATVPAVTGPQARYILEKLIDEGKLSAADVRGHLGGMWREMSFIEKRIAELRGLASSVHPIRRVKATVRRARRAITAAGMKSRALQGQYIGFLRQVPERERKRFQEMARTKGREEAIRALRKKLKK